MERYRGFVIIVNDEGEASIVNWAPNGDPSPWFHDVEAACQVIDQRKRDERRKQEEQANPSLRIKL